MEMLLHFVWNIRQCPRKQSETQQRYDALLGFFVSRDGISQESVREADQWN